jgi:3-mercaptopyruvate sulfurtransferase SseA
MTLQKQLEYVHPEVLVDTQWAEDHLKDPKVRAQHAQRGGHIPEAKNVPWSHAVEDNDGTFKSAGELKERIKGHKSGQGSDCLLQNRRKVITYMVCS